MAHRESNSTTQRCLRTSTLPLAKVRYAGATAAFWVAIGRQLWAALEGGPKLLDFNGLCNGKGIFQFNAEIPDSAVHFGVPK